MAHPFPLEHVLTVHKRDLLSLVRSLRPDLDPSTPESQLLAIAYSGVHDAHQRYDPAAATSFWAYAVHRVRGSILDEMRTQRRERERAPVPGDAIDPEEGSPERAVADAEASALIAREIGELPTLERKVLRGVYYEDRCLDDIAAEIGGGVSRSWASRLHTRALAMLRKRLFPEASRD
jgi:RNA polymerase sigma factor (sigma-70 family)